MIFGRDEPPKKSRIWVGGFRREKSTFRPKKSILVSIRQSRTFCQKKIFRIGLQEVLGDPMGYLSMRKFYPINILVRLYFFLAMMFVGECEKTKLNMFMSESVQES